MIVYKGQDMRSYLEDTSNMQAEAECVYLPQSEQELLQCLQALISSNTPVTLSSGRTGTTGGCIPQGGALISSELLTEIMVIDTQQRVAQFQAGVSLKELEEKIKTSGLSLCASPTEPLARLGGVVSTCASGVRGFGYGSIRRYVRQLRVALTTGDILDIERGALRARGRRFDGTCSGRHLAFDLPTYTMPAVKSQAGYFVHDDMDLIDLFIGSEGTLGVILSAGLCLARLPAVAADGLIFLKNKDDAFSLVENVKQAKEKNMFSPVALEFFDERSLALLAPYYSFVPKECCAVYFQQEAETNSDLDRCWKSWQELFDSNNALFDESILGDTARERERIFEFRHKLPQLINEFLRLHHQVKVSSDIAVPDEHLRAMYDIYTHTADETGIDYVNFGHIGESHLHFNFLPKNDAEYARAKDCMRFFCEKAIALGGTVSAEHGIGKLKREYLTMMYGEHHIAEMARLKKYFDPHCLLGLDTLFDRELLR